MTIITVVNGAIGGIVWNDFDADGIYDAGENYTQGVRVELLQLQPKPHQIYQYQCFRSLWIYWPSGGQLPCILCTFNPAIECHLYITKSGKQWWSRQWCQCKWIYSMFQSGSRSKQLHNWCRSFQSFEHWRFCLEWPQWQQPAGCQRTGVMGVNVMLLSPAGSMVASTFTNANGLYLFSNVTPGNYYLKVFCARRLPVYFGQHRQQRQHRQRCHRWIGGRHYSHICGSR